MRKSVFYSWTVTANTDLPVTAWPYSHLGTGTVRCTGFIASNDLGTWFISEGGSGTHKVLYGSLTHQRVLVPCDVLLTLPLVFSSTTGGSITLCLEVP